MIFLLLVFVVWGVLAVIAAVVVGRLFHGRWP